MPKESYRISNQYWILKFQKKVNKSFENNPTFKHNSNWEMSLKAFVFFIKAICLYRRWYGHWKL